MARLNTTMVYLAATNALGNFLKKGSSSVPTLRSGDSALLNINNGQTVPVILFNSLGWSRSEIVMLPVNRNDLIVLDRSQNKLVSQINISSGTNLISSIKNLKSGITPSDIDELLRSPRRTAALLGVSVSSWETELEHKKKQEALNKKQKELENRELTLRQKEEDLNFYSEQISSEASELQERKKNLLSSEGKLKRKTERLEEKEKEMELKSIKNNQKEQELFGKKKLPKNFL